MAYTTEYNGEEIELDDDVSVDDLERGAEPSNLPDMDDPAMQQALLEAEMDDSNECGKELDCDE